MTQAEQQSLCQAIRYRCNTEDYFPFLAGAVCDSLTPEVAEGHVTAAKAQCNPFGIVHGGVYYTLMDQLAGMMASATGRGGVTIDCSVNYIKSARMGETVRCRVDCVHAGRSVAVYEGRCYGEDGTLQCTGTFHLFFLGPLDTMALKLEGQDPPAADGSDGAAKDRTER